jgi:hypothetical protein
VSVLLGIVVAQGIPMAPALSVRLVALAVVEAVLLTTVVLLFIRWAQVKRRPLDEWWAERQAQGLQPRTLFEIEASEAERRAAQGDTPLDQPQPPEPA